MQGKGLPRIDTDQRGSEFVFSDPSESALIRGLLLDLSFSVSREEAKKHPPRRHRDTEKYKATSLPRIDADLLGSEKANQIRVYPRRSAVCFLICLSLCFAKK